MKHLTQKRAKAGTEQVSKSHKRESCKDKEEQKLPKHLHQVLRWTTLRTLCLCKRQLECGTEEDRARAKRETCRAGSQHTQRAHTGWRQHSDSMRRCMVDVLTDLLSS